MTRPLTIALLLLTSCGYESYYPSYRRDWIPDTGVLGTACSTPTSGAVVQLTISNQLASDVVVVFTSVDTCQEVPMGSIPAGGQGTFDTTSNIVWLVYEGQASRGLLEVIHLDGLSGGYSVVIQ